VVKTIGVVVTKMGLFGKGLIVIGLLTVVLGFVLLFSEKIPVIGKLPGDFVFQIGNVKVFAPLATCLLLSLIISFVLSVILGHK
jgi:hypothetical protein